MTEIGIRFRRRTNFDDKLATVFELDPMRTPDTRSVEQVAAELAMQIRSAELIHHLHNLFGPVRAEAVQLDERGTPRLDFSLENLNGVVDGFHFDTRRTYYSATLTDKSSCCEASRYRLVGAAPGGATEPISSHLV